MTAFDLAGTRIWVTGHTGMVGGALLRRLQKEDCTVLTTSRQQVDLCSQAAVQDWMRCHQPDVVIIAAARVGGIVANAARPADFLYENLMIEANLVEAAHQLNVRKLLFLGSSCIYPKHAPQPLTEDSLLTGPLEETNQWYAVAKIAGIKLCQAYRRQHGSDFIAAMPTNLYGPGDNFDLTSSHVMPALMRKIHQAKVDGASEVVIWGSGKPLREFMHVDDLADALIFLLKHYSGEQHVNVGTGIDVSILQLAELLAEIIDWQGRFVFDSSKPDGTPRKLMDVRKLTALGWTAPTSLRDGIARTYAWFHNRLTDELRQVSLDR